MGDATLVIGAGIEPTRQLEQAALPLNYPIKFAITLAHSRGVKIKLSHRIEL